MSNQPEEHHVSPVDGDVDTSGHVALGLFTAGIIVLVFVIYALAQAA